MVATSVPVYRFLLKFLPWFPSVMDWDVDISVEIKLFLPKLHLVKMFITATESKPKHY